jgi:hypothetical protein
MTSLRDDKPMDNRATIEVDLTDDEFMQIARLAHERDITFNQMVEHILQQEIDRRKAEDNA